jgi:hypothetical protein
LFSSSDLLSVDLNPASFPVSAKSGREVSRFRQEDEKIWSERRGSGRFILGQNADLSAQACSADGPDLVGDDFRRPPPRLDPFISQGI